MGAVDERIDQLLADIDSLARESAYEGGLPLFSDTVSEEMIKVVKKFMTDMGENIVRSQVLDDFVEYCELAKSSGSIRLLHLYAAGYKKEKGL